MKKLLLQIMRHPYLCIFVTVLILNILFFFFAYFESLDSQTPDECYEAYAWITFMMGFPISIFLTMPLCILADLCIKTNNNELIAIFIAFAMNWGFICLFLKLVHQRFRK